MATFIHSILDDHDQLLDVVDSLKKAKENLCYLRDIGKRAKIVTECHKACGEDRIFTAIDFDQPINLNASI